MSSQFKTALKSLAFPLIVGSILRVANVWVPDLWFDEVVYLTNSRGTFDDLVSNTRERNSSPIFLPLILFLFGGDLDPWVGRLPSVLAGILLLLTVAASIKKGLLAQPAGLLAIWLLALNPFLIRYSQEVREYSVGALISAVVLVLSLDVLKKRNSPPGPRLQAILLFGLALAVAPQVAYGSIFVALSTLVVLSVWLIANKNFHQALGLWVVFLLSVQVSWTAFASFQSSIAGADYLEPFFPSFEGLLDFAISFFVASGGAISQAMGNPALAIVTAVLPLVSLIRGREPKMWSGSPITQMTSNGFWLLTAMLLFVGLALAWLVGVYPMGSIRQQIPMVPIFAVAGAILIHWSLTTLKFSLVAPLVALCLVGNATLYPWVYSHRNQITQPVLTYLSEKSSNGDLSATEHLSASLALHFPKLELVTMDPHSNRGSIGYNGTSDRFALVLGLAELNLVSSNALAMGCTRVGFWEYPGMTSTFLVRLSCQP